MRPAQPNQSLIDGLAALQALAARNGPIGSRELARSLGIEPTRANRLLKTLAYVGLAEQDESRKYRPGPGIHVLAAQALHGSDLLRRSVEPLERLLPLGHMVALGVLWRTEVCYLYFARTGDTPGQMLGREAAYPAAGSGLGLALLADLDEAEVKERYAAAPDGPTELDGPEGLLTRLRVTRNNGFALTQGRGAQHVRTVGVTVGDPVVAAVGLAGSFQDGEVPDLVDRLRKTARAIGP
ncbi:helix-turn-helix domain-containing protein [Microlunatus sp. GCM10028923]|uniref:helix-turn-helix domain-containing protein n=1 Tax=Microlunatus sp. GCM10028923 TaxID=3273400 RepID=UPI00360FBE22